MRLLCLALLVGVTVVCGVSTDRFLTRSESETSVTTSDSEEWLRFWGYIQEKFPVMDVEARKFRGLGNSGAAYSIPTDTDVKLVKVRTAVTTAPMKQAVTSYEGYTTFLPEVRHRVPARVLRDVHVASHEVLDNALTAYREKYRDDPRASWAVAFVKRTVYHDKEIGYQFEVMEYVRGLTLEDYIKATPDLSVAHIKHLLRQLTQILYVMAFGRFSHEDLHPGNIMVTPTGRLVVIDLERVHLCADRSEVTLGKNVYMAHEYHIQPAVYRDTCVALDAYSMGITILSLVAPMQSRDGVVGVTPLNFRATALARLEEAKLSTHRDDTPEAKTALRRELKRVVGWLLDDHGAARTASTFALFDYFFKGSYASPASTPIFVVVGSEPDDSWDPAKGFKELPSAYTPYGISIVMPSSVRVANNALVEYMKDVTAAMFPPGDAILRRSTVMPSYYPHILFQNGLHSPVPSDSGVNDALRYNIFLLQRKYRHKLVLQVASDAASCSVAGILPSKPQDMIYIAVGSHRSVPDDYTTRFLFRGQPISELVRDDVLLHASLLSWNNQPIVGGCLKALASDGMLVLEDAARDRRKGYTFKLVVSPSSPSKVSLIMTPPKVLIVGGGPTGLVAALEAKASGAAVKIWERRDKYTRMYCQACDVDGYLKDLDMTTDQYLKSVEDTLAAVAITVGVNLQFKLEFLFIGVDKDDKEFATGRVVSTATTWFAGKPWEELKERSFYSDLRKEPFDILIGADGTTSSIRTQYLKSPFLDRTEVKPPKGRGRTLKIKTSDSTPVPIQGVTSLEFVKGACQRRNAYPDPVCVTEETGFNAMWHVQRKSTNFCFFEYIESLRGVNRVRKILRDHRIAQDGQELSQVLKNPAALDDVYQMLLARYVAVGEHTGHESLSSLDLGTVRDGEGCPKPRAATPEVLEAFKSLHDSTLFSMFWLRTRSVGNAKYAKRTEKDAVVAIVGDATRDSFFPFGNGMSEHVRAMTQLKAPTGTAATSIQKSAIGALVRGDIDVEGYNAHMDPLIQDYMWQSSLCLVGVLTCINEPRLPTEMASQRMVRLAGLLQHRPATELADKCPYLDVIDPAPEPKPEPVLDSATTETVESVPVPVSSVSVRVDPKAEDAEETLVFDENAPSRSSGPPIEPEVVDLPAREAVSGVLSETHKVESTATDGADDFLTMFGNEEDASSRQDKTSKSASDSGSKSGKLRITAEEPDEEDN